MNPNEIISVSVKAPARLHMGFLDMHGGLGRTYGSLGVCIDSFATSMKVTHSHRISAEGPSAQRVEKQAKTLIETLNLEGGVHIEIDEAIPEHIGLGSGTQMSLALGMAVTRLKGHDTRLHHIARLLGRGARSGIGIGSFKHGGFLVDGGRSPDSDVPPLISHMPFPEEWRVLLIFDDDMQGVHGSTETSAFKNISVMAEDVSEKLCRLLVMQVLPGLAEKDCANFAQGITRIQEYVGDYFAPWQDGRYCSKHVAETFPWMQEHGALGYGQSSWGPTGFAIFDNETSAHSALKQAKEKWPEDSGLSFMLSKARNQMADITITEPESSSTLSVKEI